MVILKWGNSLVCCADHVVLMVTRNPLWIWNKSKKFNIFCGLTENTKSILKTPVRYKLETGGKIIEQIMDFLCLVIFSSDHSTYKGVQYLWDVTFINKYLHCLQDKVRPMKRWVDCRERLLDQIKEEVQVKNHSWRFNACCG